MEKSSLKRPVSKKVGTSRVTQTMRPSLSRDPRLGKEINEDPRVKAFESELLRRRNKEKEMAAELKKLQEKLGEAGELDPEVVKMKKELEEKKKKEQEFVDELEDLRTKLAEKEEKDADDPYIAQLEAEVSTLKFEKLAMSENFMEMKKEFDVYKEKAEKVQELEERAEQMESFINELQEERNELFEKLQSSEQQVLQLGQMLGKVKDEDLVNNEKKLEDEIASLKQQIAQRDDELARQGEVMSGLIKSVEQRTAVSPRNPSAPNTVSAAATATVVLEKEETKNVQKTELKCLKWEQSLSEVFVSLNKGQMERNKERISMQDKKVFKDPMNQVIKGGGQILFLQNNEGEVECCCALVIGVGCYDLKYIAFRDNAPEERKSMLLAQCVDEAAEHAKHSSVDELVALHAGSRADAEKKWGPFGFKFVGVGKAPDFAVRMQKILK